MLACIIAVGSEMLTPFRVDTNSLVVTERLNAIGYDVRLKVVVGDDVDELARVFESALAWADAIVIIGGLGPTADDLTRDAVARVLQVPLDLHQHVVDRLAERYARRGITMAEINKRQALAPRGATLLDNPNGSAPGLWLERGRTAIVLVPGPPREMAPMFDAIVRERLAPRTGGRGLFRRVLKITGRTESDVDSTVAPIYKPWTNAALPISTTILAVLGQIELHLTVEANHAAEAAAVLDPAVAALEEALAGAVYSVDGRALEVVVGELLRAKGLTLAVAESCTGGLLASRLTDVPGSSDYVDRGVICYSNQAKVDLAGVPASLIEANGAVSDPVACAMAEGVRANAGTRVGVGITGIAGPGGGTADKPVGTVAVAVAVDDEVRVKTFQFAGGREHVKFQASQAAMNLLRLMMVR